MLIVIIILLDLGIAVQASQFSYGDIFLFIWRCARSWFHQAVNPKQRGLSERVTVKLQYLVAKHFRDNLISRFLLAVIFVVVGVFLLLLRFSEFN